MDRQALLGLNHYKNKNGIIVFEAPTAHKANQSIIDILYKYSDFKTTIFLSGGNTPKKLYKILSEEKKLKAGAVGQIDERFGKRGHKNSNEMMIQESGLIKYLESHNIRFYPMLEHVRTNNDEIEAASKDYDEALRFIFKYIPKSIGILGIGADGHIAGIPAIPAISKKMLEDKSSLVNFYEAKEYGSRITLNYHGLSMIDLLIVLVLGQEKRETLASMFKEGKVEDMPARFFLKPEIAKKTILITDQIT